MLLRLGLSMLLRLGLSMLLRLGLSMLLRLGLSMLLRLGLSMLLRLSLSMLLRLGLSVLLWLGVLLLWLRLGSLLLLWLSVLLRLSLSMLLRLGVLLCLSTLLLLSMLFLLLSLSPLLRLGVLLCLSSLLLLNMLLLLSLGPLLLLLSGLGNGASRNYRSDRPACRDRLRRGKFRGTPVVDRGKLLAILCCRLLVLDLRGHGRNALLTQCGVFRRQRTASDASRAVVAGAVHVGVGDVAVIDVNVGYVHVVDGAVVVETISAPIAALIAGAAVAESIVNAAVEADIWAPEAVVEAIEAGGESPISRRPQEAHLRGRGPCAGYPEVALRSIAPIAGRPQVAIAGDGRLRIFRQRRRRLLCLKRGLAVTRILVFGAGVVIGIVLVLRDLLHRWSGRSLLHRRGLLIGLLRRLTYRLLLSIGVGSLGPVGWGQIICSLLRRIGLTWLTLGAGVRAVGFAASCQTKSQRNRCGCHNDKRWNFIEHYDLLTEVPKDNSTFHSLTAGHFGSEQ